MIGFAYLVNLIIEDANDDVLEVVEGKIIKAEYLGHPKAGSLYFADCDVFEITFDNNKQFTIVTRRDLDLTVNSKLVLHLSKDNPDELYWIVDRIVKIP